MSKKTIFLIIAVCLVVLITSILVNRYFIQRTQKASLPYSQEVREQAEEMEVTTTKPPDPTFPPLDRVIKEVSDTGIIVTSKESGDMSLPKDPNKIKVYKRVSGQLILATFEDVKVGQGVTLNIIVPGKQADLIIER